MKIENSAKQCQEKLKNYLMTTKPNIWGEANEKKTKKPWEFFFSHVNAMYHHCCEEREAV